jgi:hypothetical protein
MKKISKESGQTLLVVVLLFSFISTTVVFGLTAPMVKEINVAKNLETSKKSYFTAEAGSEDSYYRIKTNKQRSFPKIYNINGATADVSLTTIGVNEQEIYSRGDVDGIIRNTIKDIIVTNGFSFNFAVQVGVGGIDMYNGSAVIGNVYSGGAIRGHNNSPSNYNYVVGSAVSAGPTGLIDQVHATSSAYANTISNSTVDKDAYYQTISNTTVGGNSYPGSSNQPQVAFPIPDSLINQWQNEAEAGGVITTPCPYTISASVTIGPQKINCDVLISGNSTVVTLTGPVWVKGNLTLRNSAVVKVADSVGNKSIPIIANDPSNQASKGKIVLENNTSFYGSTGNPDSHVLLVSQNNSAETGGSNLAIEVQNGATGNLLIYASHGEIELQNNVTLREVTAYQLTLINNAQVLYSIGLAQPLFTSGPGGTWKIRKWRESE